MRFAIGVRSDVGRVRSINEDAVAVADGLAVVADGMGGHRGGEVASRLAVEAFDDLDLPTSVDELVAVVQQANASVLGRAVADRTLTGMGTTLCAVGALDGDGTAVGVVNVGDSRVYLLDDGVLRQISEDHSFVETLVREGRLTPEQAEVHPQRNVLTRALGIEPELLVDAWRVEVADGDRFLLCSDGLFNEVGETTIAEVLGAGGDPGAAASELVELALAAGARDNVSCVVVDVVDSGRSGPLAERGVHREAGEVLDATAADAGGDATGESWLARDGAAGSSSAGTASAAAGAGAGAGSTGTPATSARRSRVTWRVGVLVLAIVATLAAAAGSVAWFARNTWWVKASGDQVAIFQGPPDGLLGIQPIVRTQGIRVADIADQSTAAAVRDGVDFGRDRTAAEDYVDRLVRDAATATTTTTTVAPEASTTTAPETATPSTAAQPPPSEPGVTAAGPP